jgi:hypothetical protein
VRTVSRFLVEEYNTNTKSGMTEEDNKNLSVKFEADISSVIPVDLKFGFGSMLSGSLVTTAWGVPRKPMDRATI